MSIDAEREKFILSYLTQEEITRMVKEALEVVKIAKPTYSQFYVGACILTHDGDYITGCNIENISYTQSVHAEGCAISKAVCMQKTNFKAVAVCAKAKNFDAFITPCGECRQFLNEFVNFLPIIMVHESGELMYDMLHEILPLSVILGADIPTTTDQSANKYDGILFKANNWLMKDTHSVTRNEMRRLLREWKFDEIDELTKKKLQFQENGILRGKFRTGDGSINLNSVQRIFEAFAKTEENKANGFVVEYSQGDNLAESLAHRIIATLSAYGTNVSLSSKEGYSRVYLKKDGDEYEIKILNSDGSELSKEIIEKIYEEREKFLVYRMLNEFYDYHKHQLLDVKKYQ